MLPEFQSVQHVSGDNFAHHQEHQTVFTACGTGSIVGALYHKL
jgi:hypothetical protein